VGKTAKKLRQGSEWGSLTVGEQGGSDRQGDAEGRGGKKGWEISE